MHGADGATPQAEVEELVDSDLGGQVAYGAVVAAVAEFGSHQPQAFVGDFAVNGEVRAGGEPVAVHRWIIAIGLPSNRPATPWEALAQQMFGASTTNGAPVSGSTAPTEPYDRHIPT